MQKTETKEVQDLAWLGEKSDLKEIVDLLSYILQ